MRVRKIHFFDFELQYAGSASVVEDCGKKSIDESEISIHSSPTSGYVYLCAVHFYG